MIFLCEEHNTLLDELTEMVALMNTSLLRLPASNWSLRNRTQKELELDITTQRELDIIVQNAQLEKKFLNK